MTPDEGRKLPLWLRVADELVERERTLDLERHDVDILLGDRRGAQRQRLRRIEVAFVQGFVSLLVGVAIIIALRLMGADFTRPTTVVVAILGLLSTSLALYTLANAFIAYAQFSRSSGENNRLIDTERTMQEEAKRLASQREELLGAVHEVERNGDDPW